MIRATRLAVTASASAAARSYAYVYPTARAGPD